jgi:succinyl-CoA synthetase beta subunit
MRSDDVLTKEMKDILTRGMAAGWVIEPEAKTLFSKAGFDVPRHTWAKSADEACAFATDIGYPVVAKVVSPAIMHKSDVGGVAVGVADDEGLRGVFRRFSSLDRFDGIVVDEMLSGVELIVGGTVDAQFGPVVLLGVGGVGVEIYRDTSIRMAPLSPKDVSSMVRNLAARKIIEGFRGGEAVNMEVLTDLVVRFSELAIELESLIESIDLNPVICTAERCVIADARIILTGKTS